jgi:two-component system sensor histidine kinase PhoQ
MDEGDAYELLANLMDNAAKWARSSVRIRARREGTRLRLCVEDDGTGFADTREVLTSLATACTR